LYAVSERSSTFLNIAFTQVDRDMSSIRGCEHNTVRFGKVAATMQQTVLLGAMLLLLMLHVSLTEAGRAVNQAHELTVV
jgi:hypothetical protein